MRVPVAVFIPDAECLGSHRFGTFDNNVASFGTNGAAAESGQTATQAVGRFDGNQRRRRSALLLLNIGANKFIYGFRLFATGAVSTDVK